MKISSVIHTKCKNSLWTGSRVHQAKIIYDVAANKPFENIWTSFSAVEKKSPKGMVIRYATRRSVIYLIVTGEMVAGTCDSIDLVVDQATTGTIRPHRAKVTDLSFVAPSEKFRSSSPTNQEPRLLRLVMKKQGPDPWQQDPHVGSLEFKLASPRDWE